MQQGEPQDDIERALPVASVLDDLRRVEGVRVREGVSASQCTTIAIGGAFAALVEPITVQATAAVIAVLRRHEQRYRVLGAGSNSLIGDRGVAEIVIRLGRSMREYQITKTPGKMVTVTAGGAMPLMTLSRELAAAGISGLEFAGGIPASLGGAVRMNAGAHGGEMAPLLQRVTLVNRNGEIEERDARELAFSYRHSELPEGGIVVGATLHLAQGDPGRCAELRASFLAERKARQPLSQPSLGSVFKNPSPERSAGALIEQTGLKGRAHGGARISTLHANWIVNPDRNATAEDFNALVTLCRYEVKERFGVILEPEVVTWDAPMAPSAKLLCATN